MLLVCWNIRYRTMNEWMLAHRMRYLIWIMSPGTNEQRKDWPPIKEWMIYLILRGGPLTELNDWSDDCSQSRWYYPIDNHPLMHERHCPKTECLGHSTEWVGAPANEDWACLSAHKEWTVLQKHWLPGRQVKSAGCRPKTEHTFPLTKKWMVQLKERIGVWSL